MTLDELRSEYPEAVAFTFGDSESLSEWLLELVRSGRKTATCEALRYFENTNEPLPAVGRRDIALNWDGTPALVIQTTEVVLRRFCDVDEAFALKEGENEDLAGWRRDHEAYFERNGGFDEKMMVVCEQFELVHDLANGELV